MNGLVAQNKSHRRNHHHILRQSLKTSEWKDLSSKIIDRLVTSEEFISASSVHTYVSMKKKREVFTIDLIDACLDSDKKVIVPKIKSEGILSHHQLSTLSSLSENKWGVMEPTSDIEVDLPDDLLVIVPMVAADFMRNRLGYGKGYYDRFLNSLSFTKIGLCYSMNISWTPLPVDTFDIKMDKVISEQFTL